MEPDREQELRDMREMYRQNIEDDKDRIRMLHLDMKLYEDRIREARSLICALDVALRGEE